MPAEYGEPLSERELEVVALVVEGLTNREIAMRLYLSPNTVKVHLRHIFAKTGVASRTELSILAVREGWVRLHDAASLEGGTAAQEEAVPPTPVAGPETESTVPFTGRERLAAVAGLLLAILILLFPLLTSRRGSASLPAGEGIVEPSQAEVVGERAGATDWEELPPMAVRRARLGLAAQAGKLFAIGGMTAEGPTARMEVYEIETGRWQEGVPRPLAAANIGAVVLGDAIYVPGGCDGQGRPLAETHRYLVAEERWESLPPLPTPLCAYALTTYQGQLYLFGGWDGARYRALAYRYDPDEARWVALAPPAVARGFGAAAALEGYLYYVGGYDGHELDSCERYDPAADRWTRCASLLLPRGGLGLVAAGTSIYAIGGGWENYLGFNERYNADEDRWTVIGSPMLGVWRNLGVTLWEGSLYAAGGWSGDYLNRLYTMPVLPFHIFIPVSMP